MMQKEKNVVIGLDIGGAHLKIARSESGRIVQAVTIATPLWLGLDHLGTAFREAASLCAGSDLNVFTMTGELSDVFCSRETGVVALLQQISQHFDAGETLIYAGQDGFVGPEEARSRTRDIASANWHATATLVAKLAGDAVFADMGSTTTDLIATTGGVVANEGYTDAERLESGELVYTGFTRTMLFALARFAPVRSGMTPLMNECFASMADVHRILGVLDEKDDKLPSADGKEKTVAASMARLARMVGRDAAELAQHEWRDLARWFSERQLRLVHDAAFRVAARLAAGEAAPIIGAGVGRWQLRRLAERMERRFVDFAEIIPAMGEGREEASAAAPAAAIALLAGDCCRAAA
jgi:probable H4MPT-linked C1 transfer pathway protein